jgi:hypothetical protein
VPAFLTPRIGTDSVAHLFNSAGWWRAGISRHWPAFNPMEKTMTHHFSIAFIADELEVDESAVSSTIDALQIPSSLVIDGVHHVSGADYMRIVQTLSAE